MFRARNRTPTPISSKGATTEERFIFFYPCELVEGPERSNSLKTPKTINSSGQVRAKLKLPKL